MTLIKNFQESANVKLDFISKSESLLYNVIELLYLAFMDGKKVLIVGNGGSAADAQHIAAEIVGRFKLDRPSLPGIALTTDTSILTAIGNDFSFDEIFSKQIEGLGNTGDVLIAISTSGNSKNILTAVKKAKDIGMKSVSLTGCGGGKLAIFSDICLNVPSNDTARIQEVHMVIYHTICEQIEKKMFG